MGRFHDIINEIEKDKPIKPKCKHSWVQSSEKMGWECAKCKEFVDYKIVANSDTGFTYTIESCNKVVEDRKALNVEKLMSDEFKKALNDKMDKEMCEFMKDNTRRIPIGNINIPNDNRGIAQYWAEGPSTADLTSSNIK